MAEMLLEELKVFQQNENELLASHAGKYVLIKGQQIVGTYNTQYEAITEGYTRFGNVPFFIKRIVSH